MDGGGGGAEVAAPLLEEAELLLPLLPPLPGKKVEKMQLVKCVKEIFEGSNFHNFSQIHCNQLHVHVYCNCKN